MNATSIRTIAAVAATLSLAVTGVASAATVAPVKQASPTYAQAPTTQASKAKTAGLWGTIDTGNLELDAKCEAEADFLNQPAMQTPAGGNTMADLKELNTGIANTANQGGCKLFPI